jgi:hypothetical protein
MKSFRFLFVIIFCLGILSCNTNLNLDTDLDTDSGTDLDTGTDTDTKIDTGTDSGTLPDYIGYIERIITNDNPWVKQANSWVKESKNRYEKHGGSSNSTYDRSTHRNGTIPWMAWGYGSKLSNYYGDIQYLNIGIEMMDILFTHQDDPSFLTYSFEILLPVYLLKRYGASDDKIKEWGEKYIEKKCTDTYNSQIKGIDNIGATPNIDHAAAAVLEYCYQILGQYPEWKDDGKKWDELAAGIVAKIDKAILPDGAFAYHVHPGGHSGPAAFYDRINVWNLTYYHLITNDPVARHGLIALSKRYNVLNKARCSEVVSIPFWKEADSQLRTTKWQTILFTASISGDPVTSAISDIAKKYELGVLDFPLMFYWNKNLVSSEIPAKLADYNATTGGPIFRDGDVNIYMTAHTKSKTPIGFILTKKNKNEVEMYTSRIDLTLHHESNRFRDVPAKTALENQAVIITDNWVAMGTVFDTRGAIVGGEGSKSGWDKSQLWFADKEGFAGGILLECTKETELEDIYGLVQFKTDVDSIDTDTKSITKSGISFTISGNTVSSIKEKMHLLDGTEYPGVTAIMTNAGKRTYKAGESFDFGLLMNVSDTFAYKNQTFVKTDKLSIRSFTRYDKKVIMVYNRSDETVVWKPDTKFTGEIWKSGDDRYAKIKPEIYTDNDIAILAKGMIVIKEY